MSQRFVQNVNKLKKLSEFHKHINKPLGVNSQCIDCRREGKKIHYQNNKEKYKQAYQNFMRRKLESSIS